MGDTIPEWALHKVEDIERQLNTYWVPEYRAIVARALAAVEAETAERVERETIEQCALEAQLQAAKT